MLVIDSLDLLLYFDILADLYQISETIEEYRIQQFFAYQTTFKYFEDIKMIFTGEQDNGNVFGFKYNTSTLKFEFFIQIKSIFESSVLGISYNDISKMLYVNTQFSNLFFNINQCLQNIDDCFSCSQDFHISNSLAYNKITGAFGQGKIDNPFTTQQSLIQSFLTVKNQFFRQFNQFNNYILYKQTQRYKKIITNVKNIETTIYVHNKYQMNLYQYILAFNFQKLLQLTIKSFYDGGDQNPSVIEISGDLKFSNFQKVTIENIYLQFDTSNNTSCSLIFDSLINQATLINIQMINKNDTSKDSCNIIQSINTDLLLKDLKLDNKSFIKHKNFITSTGAKNVKYFFLIFKNYFILIIYLLNYSNVIFINSKIKIQNLSLTNSNLGMFNIYTQKSHTNLEIDGLTIQGNKCDLNNLEKSQQTFSLFLAGVIKANNFKILQNQLCHINILQAVAQDNQSNIEFTLQNILIQDNTIWAVSQSILFSSLFSLIPQPDHQIIAKNITSINNQIQQQPNIVRDQYFLTNLIQTSKINSISLNNITLYDSHQLSFIDSEESSTFEIINFNCSYSDSFMSSHTKTPSAGCIKIQESKIIKMSEIIIDKKIAYESNLIDIINQKIDESQINIKLSNFTNIPIIQSKVYKQANPLSITASYENQIDLQNCTFFNNNLLGIPNSLIPSTAGIHVNNLVGQITIINSSFQNLYSNTDYVSIHLKVGDIEINNSNFITNLYKSGDLEQKHVDIVKGIISNGGSIFAQTETLKIYKSNFITTDSYQGGFLFLNSFTDKISVIISKCTFQESFTKLNGGLLYFNAIGSNVYLEMSDTKIEDIYLFNQQSSLIFLKQIYLKLQFNLIILILQLIKSQDNSDQSTEIINNVTIKNVDFTNIFGLSESYFLKLSQSNITIEKSNYFFVEKNLSKSVLPLTIFDQTIPSQYLHTKSCKGDFKDVTLYDFIDSYSKTYNHQMFFYSEYSNFNFTNCTVRDSQINIGGLGYFQNGKVIFDNFNVSNIIFKPKEQRKLETTISSEIQGLSTITFLQFIQSSITMIRSNAKNIDCQDKCFGGFIYTDSSQLDLQLSNFQFIKVYFICIQDLYLFKHLNKKSNEGGVIYILNPKEKTMIEDCTFDQNVSSQNGGSISISSMNNNVFKHNNKFRIGIFFFNIQFYNKQKDFQVLVKDNKFTDNIAKEGKGGSMFIEATQATLYQEIQLKYNIIKSNKAKIGGGFKYEGIIPESVGNIISGNIAELYGQNVFSYPEKLYLENINDILKNNTNILVSENMMIIKKHRSGAPLPNMAFSLRNQENDTMYLTDPKDILSKFTISIDKLNINSSSYYIRGDTNGKYSQKKNIFELANIDLIGLPSSNINLYIKSELIKNEDKKENKLVDNYAFLIQIQIDECQIGEIPKTYNDYEECSICEKGTYSFDKKTCFDCPTGANCLGGKEMIVKSGYWRKGEFDNVIVYCEHLEENCKGGVSGDDICFEGHIGPLCEECDIYGETWGESYAKSRKYSCSKCSQLSNNSVFIALVSSWTLISMFLAVRSSLDSNKIFFSKSLSKLSGSRQQQNQGTQSEEQLTGVYLKIFTNYFQIISSIASFNLAVPSGVIEFPQSIGQPIQQTLSSLDCVLVRINTSMQIIYFRFIFSMVIPFVYLFIFLLGLIVYQLAQKRKGFPIYIVYTALFFLLIYVQPDLVAQMISLISCRQIGGKQYILQNVTFECYTSSYYKWGLGFILPMLFSYTFLFPFLLFNQIRKNRETLQNSEIKQKYGFLYQEYTDKCFYWEFVKMAEKISIILALNFYSQDIKTKGVLVFIAITLYSIVSLIQRPYQNIEINKLDSYSTNVCAISVLMGVFLYTNQYSYFVYTSFGLIIGLNLWFILIILRKIIKGYTLKLEKTIFLFLQIFARSFKCIALYLLKKKAKTQKKIPEFKNKVLKNKVQRILLYLKDLTPQEKQTLKFNLCINEMNNKIGSAQDKFQKDFEKQLSIISNQNNRKTFQEENNTIKTKQDCNQESRMSEVFTITSHRLSHSQNNSVLNSFQNILKQPQQSPFYTNFLAKTQTIKKENSEDQDKKIIDIEEEIIDDIDIAEEQTKQNNNDNNNNEGQLKQQQFQLISKFKEVQPEINKQEQQEQ